MQMKTDQPDAGAALVQLWPGDLPQLDAKQLLQSPAPVHFKDASGVHMLQKGGAQKTASSLGGVRLSCVLVSDTASAFKSQIAHQP